MQTAHSATVAHRAGAKVVVCHAVNCPFRPSAAKLNSPPANSKLSIASTSQLTTSSPPRISAADNTADMAKLFPKKFNGKMGTEAPDTPCERRSKLTILKPSP